MPRLLEVFLRFLRLGVTAFGGPIAHLGYFEREFVERAKWLGREEFAEMVALCTVLPGPTSSQVGMLLGATRAGLLGSFAAWIAFTAPSAIVLGFAGWALRSASRAEGVGKLFVANRTLHDGLSAAIDGLLITALAVVFFAVISLGRGIVTTPFARVLVVIEFAIALALMWRAPQDAWMVLALGAIAGAIFARRVRGKALAPIFVVPPAYGTIALGLFSVTLVSLPIVAIDGYPRLFAENFRAGSLVFGGGHVVLAFLLPAMDGHIDSTIFKSGYGLAQAMPGPLFAFAALLGAADPRLPSALLGAIVGTIGIFTPSLFILPAALSLWTHFQRLPYAARILRGLGVGVVGLLAATFVTLLFPEFERGVKPIAVVIFFAALLLLWRMKWPAWAVVLVTSAACALYALVPHVPYVLRLI